MNICNLLHLSFVNDDIYYSSNNNFSIEILFRFFDKIFVRLMLINVVGKTFFQQTSMSKKHNSNELYLSQIVI